ncbi:uncharacterized protein MONOS_11592 [Monocercomonoides exilis]|uniref:uncharacterized protein n=1 Tax=Monocercomonoides exilis TaxID=2049356 RepID=UPI00355A1241|nr:hypothetical protein MONOS_11592 [Monocercomonoides exilis]|eukprot:MONOS_11592.1-p1 / transcript=MONOS_11592.1 / gene=MONOS_11592 / organism=Monocercomonoides_exilis_PA203 / gene_product=unspecified product / transcript_product=unspecified product / location=Mono_scaffold00589:34138-39960(+) / protein_length=1894 / sequence_SO=supercontig / SO=protein_coding / is_pseudo=false
MASEESMSMCSTSSGMAAEYSQAEGFSKLETVGFSVFFPLYDQPKHPSKTWEVFVWSVTVLQMVTLSFFRMDTSRQDVNKIARFVCFVDGTSLGYLAGESIPIVAMGCLGYFVLLAAYLVAVAAFQGVISGTQPWVISLLRWVVNVTYTILFVPVISLCITAFDCYESGGQIVHRGFGGSCTGDLVSILGFVAGIAVLSLQLVSSFVVKNMIYNHNPKHGGLWSSPSGVWQGVESCLVFGCVFAMRTLIEWPFWRGVVTVGASVGMVVYFVYEQPIYKLRGNVLMGSKWCMFGCLRLIDEIAYAIEGATGNWIVTIVLQAVGLAAGIVLCIVLLPKLGKMFRKKKYLLNAFEHQLSDICTKNPSLALPQMKNPERVEPSLSFIQEKDYRSMIHLTFADYVYTHALKTNMNNSMLCFQYASFLSAYRKNYMKANTLIQKARSLSPGVFLNFVLFCKAKENGGRTNGDSRNGTGDMNSFAFTSLVGKAKRHHELAVSAMKEFFENMTAIHPDYKAVPVLLDMIVKNEEIARKSYEELISSHRQNSEVLRSYARLLLDIYNEEDEAELILNRADLIEEESVVHIQSLSRTNTATLIDASYPMGNTSESKNEKIDGELKRASTAGDFVTEYESNFTRSLSRFSFENSAGSANEDANANKGTECKEVKEAASCEQQKLEGESEVHTKKELQWHQSSNELKKHHTLNQKNKRKKKKKATAITDLIMGNNGKLNSFQSNYNKLKYTEITLHSLNVAVLISALIVYKTITDKYQDNLQTLRNVCDLSYYTARSAAIAYSFFVYDQKLNFTDPPTADEWPSGIIQKKDLMNIMKETSDNLATMLGRIHQSTENIEVWETADVNTYLFTLTTKNETQPDGSVDEVLDTKSQILHSTSMLEVIATVSQMMHHLYLTNVSSRPQDHEYLSNIQYMVFNCPVPILDGAKRVIFYYYEILNEECFEIMATFTIIISSFLTPLTIIQLVIYVLFTKKSVTNRMKAYQILLDVPKSKMHSVISRLMRDDDADDDFSINVEMGEMQETKTYDSFCDNKNDFVEEPETSSAREETEGNDQNDNEKKNAKGSNKNSLSSLKMKAAMKHDLTEIEIINANSTSSILPGESSSDEPMIGTPLSPASSKSLFVEPIDSTASTTSTTTSSGFNLHSTKTGENISGKQAVGQNVGTRSSSQSLLLNENSTASRAKNESELATSERHSNTLKNDSSLAEQMGIKTFGAGIVGQEIRMTKNTEDGVGLNGANMMSTGNISKASLNPMLGWNNNSGILMIKPLKANQDDDLSSIFQTQSQPFLPSLFATSRNQSFSTLAPSAPISAQHTMSDYGCSSVYNSLQLLPPLAPASLCQQNRALMCSQNALLSQLEMLSRTSTAYDLHMKTEQNSLDSNESAVQEQKPQSNIPEIKYKFDDEDLEESEKDKQRGLIRNAVDDAAWEEQVEKEIEKHEAAYKQLPRPISKLVVFTVCFSTFIGTATIVSTDVVACYYVADYKPTSANIIVSGMRASILFQIHFLLTSILQPIPMLKTDQSITFPTSSNPVMHNSSHCSGSPTVARDMLVPMSNYFQAMHHDCHFGDSDFSSMNDRIYDTVPVSRMTTKFNVETLLRKADCYLAESEDCSRVDPNRMYGIKGTIYGLTTLIARMRINLERISKMEVENITFTNPEARFVSNALRTDIVEGIEKMTNMILTEGKEEVQESVTILTIVIVLFSILFIISMFGNSRTWTIEVTFVENVSHKLRELLPIKEGEKEIFMVSSMVTGHESFDKGREAILDAAQQLLTSVNQYEQPEVVMDAFYQVTSTALAVFNEEEKEMEAKNYTNIEKHKREHLLLRQRLTLIGDQLRSKNDAVKAVGKRKLVSLFDMHFTDEDITFADAAYGIDFSNQKNVEIENSSNL